MRRKIKLINEHIIDTGYTLPPHWRISQGFEHDRGLICFIAFHIYADLETDAYGKTEDAVNACWTLERARRTG